MSEYPIDKIPDVIQTVQVTTAGAGPVAIGAVIPPGSVRKVFRLHSPSDNVADLGFTVRQGDATAPGETVLDTFNNAQSNPDVDVQAQDPVLPIYTIRPDWGRPDLAIPDEVNNIMSIQRVGAGDVTVSVTFYDERTG